MQQMRISPDFFVAERDKAIGDALGRLPPAAPLAGYRLSLHEAELETASDEEILVLGGRYLGECGNDAERGQIAGMLASQLVSRKLFMQAREFVLNQCPSIEDGRFSEAALATGLECLGMNDPEAAIVILERIRWISLPNEHYMIKASVALMCAYKQTGNLQGVRRQASLIGALALPKVSWECREWWGDVVGLIERSRPMVSLQ